LSTERESTNGVLENLRLDFRECWQRLPNKGFFLVLLAAWLALFQFLGNSTLGYVHSPSLFRFVLDACNPKLVYWLRALDFQSVFHWMGDAEEGHIIVVPLVVLGLFWWKRKELMAVPLALWTPGLWVLGLALALHLFAYMVQQPKVSLVAFFAGLYGLMGLAWGPAWLRRSAFPFFLLLFCIPLGTWVLPITFRLRLLVCWLVEFVSNNLLMIDVWRDGTALINPAHHYQYEVTAACSGIRSLVAIVGLATVFAFVSFRTWWKRGALIASAFPLAVLGNLARMLAIIIASEIGGQEWGNYVHEGGPGGILSLLPYVLAFAGLMLLGSWLREPQPQPQPARGVKTA
jgi:exosortase